MKLAVVLLAAFCLAASQAKVIDTTNQVAEAGNERQTDGSDLLGLLGSLPQSLATAVEQLLAQLSPNTDNSTAPSQRQGLTEVLALIQTTLAQLLNNLQIETATDNAVQVRAEAGKPLTVSLPEQAAEIAKTVQDFVQQILGVARPDQATNSN